MNVKGQKLFFKKYTYRITELKLCIFYLSVHSEVNCTKRNWEKIQL